MVLALAGFGNVHQLRSAATGGRISARYTGLSYEHSRHGMARCGDPSATAFHATLMPAVGHLQYMAAQYARRVQEYSPSN